jgi:hypothetical protein
MASTGAGRSSWDGGISTAEPGRRRGTTMVAKAGERAQKTGDFYCESCDEKVHVTKGDKIPKCPNGHSQFGSRRNEP